MTYFDVLILEEAFNFLRKINAKHAEKILYNIRKAQISKDPKLFKKLSDEIWEFRTLIYKNQYRLLAFWDKSSHDSMIIIMTGILKKSSKLPDQALKKAIHIRSEYLKQKI